MALTDFVRRETVQPSGGFRIEILHTRPPRIVVEIEPGYDARGRVNTGTIARVRLPNQGVGDYGRCSRLVGEAEAFFRRLVEDDRLAPRF